jgi:hemolysin D
MKSAKVIELFAHERQMRGEQELAFLPAALEIVESPPSSAGRAIGATIILISCIAPVYSQSSTPDRSLTALSAKEAIPMASGLDLLKVRMPSG